MLVLVLSKRFHCCYQIRFGDLMTKHQALSTALSTNKALTKRKSLKQSNNLPVNQSTIMHSRNQESDSSGLQPNTSSNSHLMTATMLIHSQSRRRMHQYFSRSFFRCCCDGLLSASAKHRNEWHVASIRSVCHQLLWSITCVTVTINDGNFCCNHAAPIRSICSQLMGSIAMPEMFATVILITTDAAVITHQQLHCSANQVPSTIAWLQLLAGAGTSATSTR